MEFNWLDWKFEIHVQDGNGGLGRFKYQDEVIFTPWLIQIESESLKLPSQVSLLEDYKPLFKASWIDEYNIASQPSQHLFHFVGRLMTVGSYSFQWYKDHFAMEPSNDSNKLRNLGLCFPILTENEEKEFLSVLQVVKPQILVLSGLCQLMDSPRRMMNYFTSLYRICELNKTHLLFYAPSIHPHYIPLMSYLGVDIFDLSYPELMGTEGRVLSEAGETTFTQLKSHLCPCAACQQFKEQEIRGEEQWFNDTELCVNHNILKTLEILKTVQQSIREKRLWEFVRIKAAIYPSLNAVQRLLKNLYRWIERGTPIDKSGALLCTSPDDLHRPEVIRFIDRVKTRYVLPDSELSLVIVLSCSARKPYSSSRSHTLFKSCIRRSLWKQRERITEVILTSPLGLVPRELESIFPASHYDISVTGDWFLVEERLIIDAFSSYLSKLPKKCKIVGFLPQEEREFLKKACQEVNCLDRLSLVNFAGRPTDKNALDMFTEELLSLRDEIPTIPSISKYSYYGDRQIRATLCYQFGIDLGNVLWENTKKITLKRRILQLIGSNGLLATLRNDSGLFKLEIAGGHLLYSQKHYVVVFDGDDFQGKSLFAAGIADADSQIRPGDEVIVRYHDGSYLGVGKALLNGLQMIKYQYGLAVKVRKHSKKKRGSN